jgi:hypothetical protein
MGCTEEFVWLAQSVGCVPQFMFTYAVRSSLDPAEDKHSRQWSGDVSGKLYPHPNLLTSEETENNVADAGGTWFRSLLHGRATLQ